MGNSKGIKINSIEMGSFYDYELGNREYLDTGKAVLDYSLFSEFMLVNGMKVNKRNRSYDFIMCKFDYGTNNFTCEGLREMYYTDGFSIDWDKYYANINVDNSRRFDKKIGAIHYKKLMRSMGKSKEGDCIFINKDLYYVANDYISMGIELPDENPKLVEMAAYNTLTCANMINSITIPLKNILVLEDQEVKAYAKAVTVKTKMTTTKREIVDYKAMEEHANKLGYTFYKRNERRDEGYEHIKSHKIKDIENLEISIIKIEYTDKNNKVIKKLDLHSMEIKANEKGYTFFAKEATKDGYELISRDELTAEEKGIDLITKQGEVIERQECYVERSDNSIEVSNIMWDGMGIIDHSLIPKDCSGFVYLRNHMTKVCCFDGEVVQFLKDKYGDEYETKTRKDAFNNEIHIKDIRMITTTNAIKWIGKFEMSMSRNGKTPYEYFNERLSNYGYKFAIVKTAHKSKYGNLQRMSYQGMNSLPCFDVEDLTKIAQTSINYADILKSDNEAFLKHLEINANNYNINNLMIDLARQYPEILKTYHFQIERNNIIGKFIRDKLELGKLLQEGDNLTIAGNVYSLLMYAVDDDWMNDPTLNVIDGAVQCYTTRFNDGEHLAGYRSPQNAPNNYGYYINRHSDLMQKYFPNLGDNVICINMIHTDNQPRLSGHDMDTDGIYCTNQPEIVKYTKLCYEEYPTMINKIPKVNDLSDDEKNKYQIVSYTNSLYDHARMDSNISRYQCGIGWSSNVAQLALSYYYDNFARTGKKDQSLEDVYIICSCLAQCYIDSAKRTFALDLNGEMKRLSTLPYMNKEKKYPRFYAKIKEGKFAYKKNDSNNKKQEKKEAIDKINSSIIEECKCPMDLVADIIRNSIVDLRGTKKNGLLNIKDFLISRNDIMKVKDRKQVDLIEGIIEEYDNEVSRLDAKSDDYYDNAISITEEVVDRLRSLTIPRENMYRLVRIALGMDKMKFKRQICNRMLIMLYNYDSKKLMSLFKNFHKKSMEVA